MDRFQELENKYFQEVLECLTKKYHQGYETRLRPLFNNSKSPIEKLFMLGFIRYCEEQKINVSNFIDLNFEYSIFTFGDKLGKSTDRYQFYTNETGIEYFSRDFYKGIRYLLVSQFEIGKYKADFLLIQQNFDFGPTKREYKKVIIECDGRDFHEKTKFQAQHDKRRDRFIQSRGHQVLRFTGSELHKDPLNCVLEVIKFFSSATPYFSFVDKKDLDFIDAVEKGDY